MRVLARAWRRIAYLILDDAAELIVRLQCLMQLIDLLLVHLLVLVRDVRRVEEVEEGVGRLLDLEGAHLCEGRWRERAGSAERVRWEVSGGVCAVAFKEALRQVRCYAYYLALLLLLLLYHMDRQVLPGLPFNIGTNRLGEAVVLILGVH